MGQVNIVKMSVCPKLIINLNVIPIKIPARFLSGTQEMDLFGNIKALEYPRNFCERRSKRGKSLTTCEGALKGQSRHRTEPNPTQEKPWKWPEAAASQASVSLADGEKWRHLAWVGEAAAAQRRGQRLGGLGCVWAWAPLRDGAALQLRPPARAPGKEQRDRDGQIGRASCRERV